jgi:hypothetical protein
MGISSQAGDRIYASVIPAELLGTGIDSFRAAPELAPGLLELLVADRPERPVFLTDDDVARLGGRVPLREAALANLRSLPAPGHLHIDHGGGNVEAIFAESGYTASRLLVLPDLLVQVLEDDPTPHGVLVAMPSQHRALVHVLRDRAAVPSLKLMACYSRLAHSREPDPISPEVFWWHDGSWSQLSVTDAAGRATIRVGAQLAAILHDLSAAPA